MFAVFALWALLGFEYPFGGLPRAMNVASKLLAFAAALSLLLRRDWTRSPSALGTSRPGRHVQLPTRLRRFTDRSRERIFADPGPLGRLRVNPLPGRTAQGVVALAPPG